MMATVTVYSFRWWHLGNEISHPRKAVANRIAMLPQAEIIEGTAEDIDEAELSQDGYWYPERATPLMARRPCWSVAVNNMASMT